MPPKTQLKRKLDPMEMKKQRRKMMINDDGQEMEITPRYYEIMPEIIDHLLDHVLIGEEHELFRHHLIRIVDAQSYQAMEDYLKDDIRKQFQEQGIEHDEEDVAALVPDIEGLATGNMGNMKKLWSREDNQ